MGNLQVVFALNTLTQLVPLFILHNVDDAKGTTSRTLLSRILRGNVLSYAYNATIFSLATTESTRAQAAEALSRSGNPLTIEQLIQALADASPKVRRSAAHALNKSQTQNAAEPLVDALLDGASDIHSKTTEALNHIGQTTNIDPLIDALNDNNPQIRISTIRSLASIQSEEVHELLFWHFGSEFDPLTFPTLVDVLADREDRRIVKIALDRLEDFPSPAVRLQLLNAVCHTLGARDRFYRLLSREDTDRVATITNLLQRTTNTLCSAHCITNKSRTQLKQSCQKIVLAYEEEKKEQLIETIRQIVRTLHDGLSANRTQAYPILSTYIVLFTIANFLKCPVRTESPVTQKIFLTVCLARLATLIREIDKET